MSTASDLSHVEQERCRVVLRFLRVRFGGWTTLAKVLKFKHTTLARVAGGHKTVTASMAVRLARLLNLGVDQLLAGAFPPAGACPICHGGLPGAPDLMSSFGVVPASPTTLPMTGAQRA